MIQEIRRWVFFLLRFWSLQMNKMMGFLESETVLSKWNVKIRPPLPKSMHLLIVQRVHRQYSSRRQARSPACFPHWRRTVALDRIHPCWAYDASAPTASSVIAWTRLEDVWVAISPIHRLTLAIVSNRLVKVTPWINTTQFPVQSSAPMCWVNRMKFSATDMIHLVERTVLNPTFPSNWRRQVSDRKSASNHIIVINSTINRIAATNMTMNCRR